MRYRIDPAPDVVDWLLLFCHPQAEVRERVQRKFHQAFRYIQERGPAVELPHLRKLQGYEGVYEIRVGDTAGWFRLFCAFGKERRPTPTLVAVAYGLRKVERNVSRREYEKAARAVWDYLEKIDQ